MTETGNAHRRALQQTTRRRSRIFPRRRVVVGRPRGYSSSSSSLRSYNGRDTMTAKMESVGLPAGPTHRGSASEGARGRGKSPLFDGRAYCRFSKRSQVQCDPRFSSTLLLLVISRPFDVSFPFIKNCNERFSFGRPNNNGLVEQVAALPPPRKPEEP